MPKTLANVSLSRPMTGGSQIVPSDLWNGGASTPYDEKISRF